MRKELKIYLMGMPNINAWQREKILQAVENMYEREKYKIVMRTIAITSFVICAVVFIVNHFLR